MLIVDRQWGERVNIRFGFELAYACDQATPMVLALTAQPGPSQRLLRRDVMKIRPKVRLHTFRDDFGNVCTRVEIPRGITHIRADGVLKDSGYPEPAFWNAGETPVSLLPAEALMYLLPSRYCESDSLANEAQSRFSGLAPGWSRVQAICDFVHAHVTFGYKYARPTRTALETFQERQGVCRDMAHLAISLCRAMNIPARYATSYLGDIGVPQVDAPMDFAACFEAFLDGRWHVFDPRNNIRRTGRLIIARGRDAADVAISTSYGPATLEHFEVWTYPVRHRGMSVRAKGMLAAALLLGTAGIGLALGRARWRVPRI